MKGIYKRDRELYVFDFITYRQLDWKRLLERKGALAPRLFFHRRGILALYSLKHCLIEDGVLYYKGREYEIIRLKK